MKTPEEWWKLARQEGIADAMILNMDLEVPLSTTVVDFLGMIQREAERKGAEEMRERCAKRADCEIYEVGGCWGAELRALPLSGDKACPV